jgi:hypothetical protein
VKGFILQSQTDTTEVIVWPRLLSMSTNCAATALPQYQLPVGYYIVAEYHTHPGTPGVMAGDCTEGSVHYTIAMGVRYGAEPSDQDFAAADALNSGVPSADRKPGMTRIPSYVFDKNNADNYLPNTAPDQRKQCSRAEFSCSQSDWMPITHLWSTT